MTLHYDMAINQGETVSIIFPVIDPINQPVTVDGWTGRAQVRETELSPVLYEWSAGANNIVVAGTTVTLSIAAAVSSLWRWSTGEYDIEITDPAGSVYRIAQGRVRVDAEITQ